MEDITENDISETDHDALRAALDAQAQERAPFWNRFTLGDGHFYIDREGKQCLLQIEGKGSIH